MNSKVRVRIVWLILCAWTVLVFQIWSCSSGDPAAPVEPPAPQTPRGWYWVNPLPVGGSFGGVAFVGKNRGYVVGSFGIILRTTDGGTTWEEQSSGTNTTLKDVSFLDKNVGVVVGNEGTILLTTNGGQTWTPQASGTTNDLFDVSIADRNHVTAVGDMGTILNTSDGGRHWNAQATGVGTTPLNGVCFSDTLTGTVVGEDGIILRTTNGGADWVPQVSGTTVTLESVFFTDANWGSVVGNDILLRTHSGGDTWLPQEHPWAPSSTVYFTDVAFVDQNIGLAVGGSHILSTENSGAVWGGIALGNNPYPGLESVAITGPGTGVAVGNFIYTSTTGDWIRRGSSVTQSILTAVTFSGKSTGMAVGELGEVLVTKDGGASWKRGSSGTYAYLNDVALESGSKAVAVGGDGTILRTVDGGTTWLPQDSGSPLALLEGVAVVPATAVFTVVGSSGTVLRSTDGGITWAPQSVTSNNLHDVAYSKTSVGTGVMVGDYATVFATTDGGVNWTSRPTGVAAASFVAAAALSGEEFLVAGNVGIMRTADAGATWTPVYSTSVTRPVLDISMTPDGSGTAVGNAVLRTLDGGLTWSVQPLDHKPPYQSAVCFTDRNTGVILSYGGIILRTTTGGEP